MELVFRTSPQDFNRILHAESPLPFAGGDPEAEKALDWASQNSSLDSGAILLGSEAAACHRESTWRSSGVHHRSLKSADVHSLYIRRIRETVS
jgi:hypothetical protein